MKLRLGTKVLVVVGAILVVLSGAAFGWYAHYRFRSLERESIRIGEAMADAFGTALSAQFENMSIDEVRRSIERAGNSPVFASVVLLGATGEVIAAAPALERPAELESEPRCSGCHDDPDRVRAKLVASGGEHRVELFRTLARLPSCQGCHGEGDGPLGHLVIDVPVTGAFERLEREAMTVLAGGVAVLALLLAATYGFLRAAVIRPLHRLRQAVERFEAGEGIDQIAYESEDELGQLATALHKAARAQQDMVAEISPLAAHLRDRGVEVQLAFSRLREGVTVGRTSAEGIFASVGELDRALEQTRSHLDAIARSTGDNSSSLVQMSASIDEVAETADQLAQHVTDTASNVFQMVESIGDVAESVEGLAGETEVTVSSMSQIDASTRQIEENAREAAGLSGRMAEAAREGSRDVQETLRGIHASYEVIRETAKAMDELADGSRAIGSVVKIINEINDKTKLLALNAAIIAAQAGEHGKSFAVVANEIQNLSDRTTASTGEISRIIRGIQERTQAAAEAVGRGEDATARSVQLAERAGESLRRILETALVSNDMTLEILRATEEQSRGSQNVMASMQQVSAMVAHIRGAAQSHRTSSETVSRSTEVMRDLTEQVKLATAEQADVSRYISDAVAAIDRNLREIVDALERERGETEKILEHIGRLKERTGDQETGILEVEAVIRELQEQIERLERRAGELLVAGGDSG